MDEVLQRSLSAVPTFDEVGLTRPAVLDGAPLPTGWNHLVLSRPVGRGRAAFEAAAECVLAWGMHRGAGIRVRAEASRAVQGTTMVSGIGVGPLRISAPCRVVWTVDEPDRRGFGYATLPGHPERGEEAFLVALAPDGTVTFTVAAFSRPALWWSRLAGPVVVLLQHVAARAYTWSVRRAASAS